jgi:ATP-dependent DNA helicase RecQ
MEKHLNILRKYWGFNSFRSVQLQIIESISEGRDTLGLMPTGGGKSITFQVPALSKEGVCLVISPLIALMTDQVEKLKSLGIKACALHSGLSYNEINILLDNAVYGAYKILYISPERLLTDVFKAKIQAMPVSFITVDEAHCISEWGYDFRPSYLAIADIRKIIPKVPILALTATATPKVAEDIQHKLLFREKHVIQSSFIRENLVYFVRNTDNKINDAARVAMRMRGSGIIYLRSRKKVREISEFLKNQGISSDFYHAGLSYENRSLKQYNWTKGISRVMVATNAFGMGIDKPDVRFVIHMDLPDSLESYFQEAGRAGRDEKKAFAVLLVNNYDKSIAANRINTAFPEIPEVKRVYEAMCNFIQVPIGGGKGIAYDFSLYNFASAYKFNALVSYNSLKILEKSGYIELTDELNNPSRILFTLSRDDLYKFQIENQKFDGFIKLLLRSYTGVFSDYTVIDEEVLSKRANIPRDLVYQYLVKLSQMKVISYIPAKKTPLLIFTEERLDLKSLYISAESYSQRRTRYEDRLNAMLDYAFNTNDCRSNLLLRYFGQPEVNACGDCDVCRKLNDEENDGSKTELADRIIKLLWKESLSLTEIATVLTEKEDAINQSVRFLLEKELIVYEANGKLNLSE